MNGIEWSLLAGFIVALSNFCMRRGIGIQGNSKGYLMVSMTVVFLVAILLNPVRTDHYAWSNSMAGFGLVGGLVLAIMLAALGKALESGPAGLTFAILNSSTVMPVLVMMAFFGVRYGFTYTLFHAVGSLLVVIGLFWAGWQVLRLGNKSKWAVLSFVAFLGHVIFLVFMQWRVLFIHFPGDDGLYLSFDVADAKSQWFMPMVFLSSAIFQWIRYFLGKRNPLLTKELLWGVAGGGINGVGTFFLIRSTEAATPLEQAMIFPIFSVVIVLITNLWGQFLYKEKVNWLANSLCLLGIFIGTADWSTIARYFI